MSDEIARTPARVECPVGGEDQKDCRRPYPKAAKRSLSGRKRRRAFRLLRERDGDGCCFGGACLFGTPLDFVTTPQHLPEAERITIEHVVPWHLCQDWELEHLALAHAECNHWHGKAMWRARSAETRAWVWYNGRCEGWPALTYCDELEFE